MYTWHNRVPFVALRETSTQYLNNAGRQSKTSKHEKVPGAVTRTIWVADAETTILF